MMQMICFTMIDVYKRQGVVSFLSGMALANSGLTLLLVHPFVIILKPAVAMSAQPDSTLSLIHI